MAAVNDILHFFEEKFPFYMKLDFDNIGLLVGSRSAAVTKVLTALDITDAVIEEAVSMGAQLIVSHHPLIWEELKRVTDEDNKARKVIRLLQSGVSAICLHTNLDSAEGGVNDALMAALGARVTGLLAPHGSHPDGSAYGIARLGELPAAMELDEFLAKTKANLNTAGLRYVSGGKPVHRIACCGGSGGSELETVLAAGCDTYVTADLKYDHFLLAKEEGLNLIDADHFCTENVVVPVLRDTLQTAFPEVEVHISAVHGQTVRFF